MQDTIHRYPVRNAQPEDATNFRRLVEAANDLSWICQLDWTLTYLSPQLYPLFGYTPEEWLGRSWRSLIHPEDCDRIAAVLQSVIESREKRLGVEFRHAHKQGKWRWASLNVDLIQDHTGSAIGLQGIVQDIDDRKADKAKLREQEQLLQSVYEAVEHSITTVDVLENEEFCFVGWNPATEKITGIPSAAIVGKTPEALMGELHGKMVQQDYRRCLEAGTSITYEEFLPIGGRDLWWLTTLNPIKDDRARICRIVVTSFDITDRKQVEAKLQQKEAQYRSIFETLNDGILITDLETGQTVEANPAAHEIYGYTSEEFMQLEPSEFVHPDYLESFSNFLTTIQTGERFFCEVLNLHKNRSYIHVEVIGVPFLYNSKPHALSVFRDISDRKVAEAALQQAEAHYRSIFEAINDGINIINLETGRVVAVNPAFCEMHGYTAEEFLQLEPSQYVHADSFSRFSRFVETIQAGKQFFCEAINLHKDGTGIDVEITAVPFLYNNQSCALSIVRDIRERKAAETALRDANALLNSVLETIPGFFFVKDLEGRHLALNSDLAEFFGRPIAEVIGKTDADLLPPEVALPIMQKDRSIMASGLSERFEEVVPTRGVASTYLTTKKPLYNTEGDLIGMIGMALDISDRKTAEQAQARLTAILEATSDLVGIADMQGGILYLNAAGHDLLEIPPEEDLIGFPIDSLHSPATKQMLAAQAFPIAIQQGIWQGESSVVTRSGCEIPVSQVVIAHTKADGTPEYLSTIIRNITVQKQAEIALQQKAQELETALQELQRTQLQMIQAEKMSSLGQLVAGVAHEINNPVNFIYGNVAPAGEYIQDLLKLINLYQTQYPHPSPVIQEKIEAIDLEFIEADLPRLFTSMKMGADRIRQIVRSLRTFSRLDEAACKEVDVHEGIDSTLVILENRLKAKPAHPAVQVIKRYGDLPLVECYAGQLNQVFMNILTNALDALEERDQYRSYEEAKASPSCIEIRTGVLDGDRAEIRIADNGVGIPEAVRQRIFDPFFTTKPVGKGTGMGMSISYQIITENHGGTIQCISTSGQGAEFVIEIPLRQQFS